jgi:glycosyltransferase involved in cell wall biosynthesis
VTARSALVYGDVDLNLLDGSATWVQSMVQSLAAAGCSVTLLLKAPVRTDRLVAPLVAAEGVRVVRPFEEQLVEDRSRRRLSPADAVALLTQLDARNPADLLVVRGLHVADALAASGAFDGRLWTYLTDVPQWVGAVDEARTEQLSRIAAASRFLLCQTEELRCFLEGMVTADSRCVLFPPVVPEVPAAELPARDGAAPLRMVYTGKMAPLWNTEAMTQLPALLRERGVPAELHVIGDKIHDDRLDPQFAERMRRALDAPGVVWHGGLPREEAMRCSAAGDVGISWRHRSLDASLELSTKVLEFGSLGLPVLLNRTPMHEQLLGADYPLFAADCEEVVDALSRLVTEPQIRTHAVARTAQAATEFGLPAASARLRGLLHLAFPVPTAGLARRAARPLRVLVAGHDLKFFTPLMEHLRSSSGIDVRVDAWPALAEHDERSSRELRDWADVVICEWAGPVAVWYSRNKRPGQRLLVRLHRFELDSPYPSQIRIDAVDHVICVSPYYARLTREVTGWPPAKVVVVPNAVDVSHFDRPKLAGAQFNLGFIGMAPMRKRLDLAVEVLDLVRREDRRFQLCIKSKLPWDYWWIWQKDEERAHATDLLRRIQGSPRLKDAVIFDGFGSDVASWLRRIGFVLSTSDDESFHLAPAEGMAAGSVPVIRRWPGADEIYADRWLAQSPKDMARRVLELSSRRAWEGERALAQEQVRRDYERARVERMFEQLVAADSSTA